MEPTTPGLEVGTDSVACLHFNQYGRGGQLVGGTGSPTVGLGLPFPPLAERFERLEELVQIALQMWCGDEQPYAGTHYQLPRPLNSPNTLQHPHPPILIAGSGEQKTLRLVARYGDMCNLFDLPGTGFADDLKRKLDVLRSHCEDAGRDYDAIEKTVSTFVDPDEDRPRVLDHLAQLADLGIDHAMVSPGRPWDEATLDRVATMVPDVHAISAKRVHVARLDS